jgi:putative effector of murein hydrolase
LIAEVIVRGFALPMPGHDAAIAGARPFRAARARAAAVAGVLSGIAMSLNALVTSLLVPLAVTLLVR